MSDCLIVRTNLDLESGDYGFGYASVRYAEAGFVEVYSVNLLSVFGSLQLLGSVVVTNYVWIGPFLLLPTSCSYATEEGETCACLVLDSSMLKI
jgi:hypothetical protein